MPPGAALCTSEKSGTTAVGFARRGERRDGATIALALTAAETGHLLLCTLHARSASQAFDRLVDAFPAAQHNFVRSLLAASLLGVMAQQLVRRPAGGWGFLNC